MYIGIHMYIYKADCPPATHIPGLLGERKGTERKILIEKLASIISRTREQRETRNLYIWEYIDTQQNYIAPAG